MNMENMWNMEVQTQTMTVILQWDIVKHIMEYKLFNPPVLIKHIPEKTHGPWLFGREDLTENA